MSSDICHCKAHLICSSVENMKAEVCMHHTPDLTGVHTVMVCRVERELLQSQMVSRPRKATIFESWLQMTRVTPDMQHEAILLFFSVSYCTKVSPS